MVEYLAKNSQLLTTLVEGYTNPEIALNCGVMLRECIRHEALCAILLQSESFWKFFSFVEMPNFDIASDAFSTFKELLTKHKAMCAEFLEKNYDRVFEEYTKLLNSQNYVTKRQSLKLLGELLLDRANFNVMTKYISQQKNLKLMMILLRYTSHNQKLHHNIRFWNSFLNPILQYTETKVVPFNLKLFMYSKYLLPIQTNRSQS
jgi:calcium binding protein 39